MYVSPSIPMDEVTHYTAQNGRIVDGLGLFKKNVTLHFEGQVECAICYS